MCKFTRAVFLYQPKKNIAFSILKKILLLFHFKSIIKLKYLSINKYFNKHAFKLLCAEI